MDYNVLIVGVGGQGTLLASRVLGAIASLQGKDCKLSEVHGMAQRGGSVVTHVRVADKVFAPIIAEGDADIIIAFEKLEAFRWRHYLKKDGKIIVNDQEIMPMPVITGVANYPADIYNKMRAEGKEIVVVEGLKLAGIAGNTKAVNTVMIGRMVAELDFDLSQAQIAVANSVPSKLLTINQKAIELGYQSKI